MEKWLSFTTKDQWKLIYLANKHPQRRKRRPPSYPADSGTHNCRSYSCKRHSWRTADWDIHWYPHTVRWRNRSPPDRRKGTSPPCCGTSPVSTTLANSSTHLYRHTSLCWTGSPAGKCSGTSRSCWCSPATRCRRAGPRCIRWCPERKITFTIVHSFPLTREILTFSKKEKLFWPVKFRNTKHAHLKTFFRQIFLFNWSNFTISFRWLQCENIFNERRRLKMEIFKSWFNGCSSLMRTNDLRH